MTNVAAGYARKSTEQNGVADEAKSVTRQIEGIRAYAARKGWVVPDEYIFFDDGISGAEFATRPGFLRLMNAVKPRPPFKVLIMSEESRLGREAIETAYALKQLVTAGVRVFFYLEDRERTLDSATDKIMLSLTTFADEVERERARQRTYDAMQRKAKAGHVTGGKVFGYDNVRVDGHVERRKNDAESAVVVEIYERYARGEGYKSIAHELNRRNVPKPRAQKGRPSGWEVSTIMAILERQIYRGEIVWNQSRKRNTWGQRALARNQRRKDENEWIRLPAPHLRIVSEEVAAAVDARRAEMKSQYLRATQGKFIGRPHEGKYLLTGMMKCPCGANYEVLRDRYVCAARRRKGPDVCPHTWTFAVRDLDDAILTVIEGQVLAPSFIDRVIETAYPPAADPAALQTERAQIRQEITNLTAAITAGGQIEELVAALKERKRRLTTLDFSLRAETPDRERLRPALEQRIADWRDVLRQEARQGRQVLRQVVRPIQVRPFDEGGGTFFEPTRLVDAEGWTRQDDVPWWEAPFKPEGLLVGLIQSLASPTGTGGSARSGLDVRELECWFPRAG